MKTELATKVGKHIFVYHLVGFNSNIVYSTINRTIIVTEVDSGALVKTVEQDEDLDFEDFVLVARNLFLNAIEISS